MFADISMFYCTYFPSSHSTLLFIYKYAHANDITEKVSVYYILTYNTCTYNMLHLLIRL